MKSLFGRAKKSNDTSPDLSLKDQFSALKYLPPFFKLIWETNPWMASGNVLLRLSRSAIPLAMLYVGKLIVDEVIRLKDAGGEESMQYLWLLVGIELVLAVFSDLTNRGITLLDSLLGDLFSNNTSVILIRHAAKMDLYQFEDAQFYDKLERARRQTVGRVVLMSQVLSQVQESITIGILSVGLMAFNPWLIFILVVAVVPSFLGESYFNEKSYSLSRSWTPERRRLDYMRYIGASDQTSKEVKVFNLSGFLADRFHELSDKFYQVNKKLAVSRASWGSFFSFIGTGSYYFAYIFIILATVAGQISVGDLTFLAGSFNRVQSLLQGIMGRFTSIAQGALYLKDLFDFLAIEPTITSPPQPLPFPMPIKTGFVFEDVGFQYHGSKQWAVRGLSFHLRAGEKLALVGENGAGKTTLVKLLARLYEPTEGRILLDGQDLRAYDLQDLRSQIGVIFQDYMRFQMSVSDNIAVGNIDQIDNRHLIAEAARKSMAEKVIDKLPAGYEQMLGKYFMDGAELSGGEWQKIALARAYMRNAQLLILDEPTSALDARAEHEVFQRFAALIEGKSAVLISHRFSTVRMADRILFLDGGRVLELGSHEELIAQGGKYAELFNLQAQGYH